jgi:Zn-dependent protease
MPFTAPAFFAKAATVRPAARPTGLDANISATSAASKSAIVRFTAVLLERARHKDRSTEYLRVTAAASSRYASGTESTQSYDEFVSQVTPEREAQEYPPYDLGPVKPEPRFRLLRKLAAPLIVIGAFLAKFKFILFAIFKLKVFTTSATMLVSIAAYALLWGWKFAIGFVLLILVHELGHALEAKRQGIPISAPLFIPFVGALIAMKQLPNDVWREAKVALAGPILGSLGAAAVWAAAVYTDSDLLRALAFTGFFLNLFNLVPIVPLDGGRAVAALHPAFWIVGLAMLTALTFLAPNPILILILAVSAFELWNRWRARDNPEYREYYSIAPWQRVVVAVLYLGLAAALAVAMSASYIERDF